ncbi:MAG: T9SS type A sorting domain-containing protein [Candidatus Electryonea clarkiae]|nr:T9SS type A sorting domain-containing protein [Candidatus Electryonea clarkiae]
MTEPPPVPTFEEHTIKGNFEGATSVFAADFDGDGDMDVLGAAYTADDIVWFENDVAGNWNENPVNVDFDGARCVHAADINGDGDMDVLGAALEDDDIKWWKNDGEGGFSRHSIDDNFDGANSVYAADLDGDGDLDVLGSAEIAHDISWWENDGTPDVGDWTEHAIDADFLDAKSVYAADIDGDGDIDVLGASYDSDDIAWWVNDGTPDEGEWTMHTVEGSFTGAFSVHAADVDGDGNMDVLGGAENDNLAWFENDGTPLNGGWTEHTIGNFVNVKSVYAADVDGDGDIDVLGTAYLADDITWWENNGSGSFTEHTIAGNFWRANSVHACDVDGDGDIDVLGTAYNGNDITWWENTQQPQPEPETWTENTIEGDFFVASSVFATDVDGDGDTDVLGTSANADDITWWENDGSENFTEHTIQGDFDGASSVYASDVDGDGDVDVLGTADAADDITWWENDGNENFTEHTILGTFDGAKSVYATDVDGDGDVDVLGAAEIADDITWFENDGNENFTEHTILGTFDGAKSVYATDVDSDGDTDILGAAGDARDITWWENDGSQTFTEHTIKGDFDGAYSVYATDMDGDGDVDVLGAAFIDDDITWFENDGSQNFTERGIAGMFMNAYSVYATDVDGDDDVDVLGAASSADDITWWENDGSPSIGGWVEHTIDASFDYAVSVYATDVDGDGDVDVLGAAGEAHDITWWANDINPNVSPARFKHAIPRNRWEMVGVPCNVSDGSPGTLFQADFDGNVPSGSNWMISRYDAVTTGYRRYEEANNNGSNGTPEGNPADFTPGLGYWVIQDVVDNAVMDITIAQSTGEVNTSNRFDVQITAPMTIPTRRGLTQVANPFNHTIDWRDARIYNATDDQYLSIFEAAAANWISGYAYVYDGWAESYTNTNFYGITAPYDLDTWQGFWIEQLLASDELHVQFVPQGMLHKAAPDHNPRRPASEVGEWTLNLEISTSDEVYSDPNNRLGVNAFSSDGYDMMDAIEFTPASGSFVHLYFPHEEWFPIADRFTYDYRAADVNNERVWDFEVRSWNLVERELKLIWSDIAEIPEEVDFVLSDSSDMEINLRDEESYSFFTGEERNQYFYFRITSTGNIQASEQPGTIPTEFGLVALYPNPFNSTVRISYSLLRQEQVSLSVYNVLGREVAKLADGRLSAGIYSTTWKADGFASGVYFVRLETEKQKSIKKFILLQ